MFHYSHQVYQLIKSNPKNLEKSNSVANLGLTTNVNLLSINLYAIPFLIFKIYYYITIYSLLNNAILSLGLFCNFFKILVARPSNYVRIIEKESNKIHVSHCLSIR